MLTFVIPVRHPSSISEPAVAKILMADTLASVAAQTSPDWTCVIAAEPDADLPPLPPGVEVVTTNIPAPDLPDIRSDKRANRQAVRMDKGARIMTALVAAQPRGYVMVVDYDDLISRRLAAFCSEHSGENGWYVESGWLFGGGAFLNEYPENFSRLCGTSILVHSRLLNIPQTVEDVDFDYAGRTLGDHVFIRPDLEAAGTPLAPLPFPGAIYRVGHRNSASLSVSMFSRMLNTSIMRSQDGVEQKLRYSKRYLQNFRMPGEIFRSLIRTRPVTPFLRREFFGESKH